MYKSLRPRWCAASSPQGSRHCPRRGRQAGRSGASAYRARSASAFRHGQLRHEAVQPQAPLKRRDPNST